jgi:carboxymethylenebutenolidase
MRILGRIVAWVFGILAVLIGLLFASIFVDGALGGGRLRPLINTSISNPNGPEIQAFVARPEAPGTYPAVIMIHEWWGLKAEITDKAQALANEGYIVVAPDLFRGSTTDWIPRAIWQVSTTPATQVDSDLGAVYTWLASQPDVQVDKIGIMGFCFGGGTSLRYSLSNPNLAATAIFYGSTIADVEQLKGLSGPVLGVFGGADGMIPVTEVQAFEQALNQAGIPNQITIYDGQPHAFVQSIDQIRQGGPAGEAWNELLTFLNRNLKGQATSQAPHNTAFVASTMLPWSVDRAMHVFFCDPAVVVKRS